MQVTCFKTYSPDFPYDPSDQRCLKKLLTEAQARKHHEDGKFYSLAFGDPTSPNHCMDIFEGRHRVDVTWLLRLPDGEVDGYGNTLARMRTMVTSIYPKTGRTDLFAGEYHVLRPEDGGPPWGLRPHVAFNNEEGRTAISVTERPAAPVQRDKNTKYMLDLDVSRFWLGPYPSFEDLVSGAYVARLPSIERPDRTSFLPYDRGREPDPEALKRRWAA